eukprot:m.15788 g.15788  ORF g.15788 m.15788 type:complete len:154 (+) comp26558_c0_seq1:109-570(+)
MRQMAGKAAMKLRCCLSANLKWKATSEYIHTISIFSHDFVAGTSLNQKNTKNNNEALKSALHNPFTASKDQKLKDQAFQIVMRVLMIYKSSEMEKAVASLDREQIDILMKYIYRGFEEPSEKSSSVLLQWHEKVLAKGGIGSVVRVMTDRKTV